MDMVSWIVAIEAGYVVGVAGSSGSLLCELMCQASRALTCHGGARGVKTVLAAIVVESIRYSRPMRAIDVDGCRCDRRMEWRLFRQKSLLLLRPCSVGLVPISVGALTGQPKQ